MEEAPDFTPGSKSWVMSVRENLKDRSRGGEEPSDSPAITASRKYLRTRARRREIESIGGAAGAWPYRQIEIARATKLASILEVDFLSRAQLDAVMPTLARMQLEDPYPPEA